MVLQITSSAEFQKAIAANKLTVVDFFATWCGPCKAIAPLVEQLSKQYTDVAFIKVDVDQVPDVAKQCAITAMPTFQFYKSGNKVDEFKGADANRLKSTIDKHRVAGAGNGNFPSGGGHRLGDGTPASSSSSSAPSKPQAVANKPNNGNNNNNNSAYALFAIVALLFVLAYIRG